MEANRAVDWIANVGHFDEIMCDFIKQITSNIDFYLLVDLDLITPILTPQDNDKLLSGASREEIKTIVFHLEPEKTPGPDAAFLFSELLVTSWWFGVSSSKCFLSFW